MTVLLVAVHEEATLFIPELEAPRVEPGPFEVVAWGESEDPVALASRLASPAMVAVGDHMWSVFLTRFQARWPDAAWRPASEITGSLRMIKDGAEVDFLRSAAHAVDRVMARIPGEVAFAGRTEADVARDLERLIVEEGHESAEFTIVGSGANGASPHHHAGKRVIEDGDLVVCDFGGRLGGYYSDSTRTFVVGSASSQQLETHEVVVRANQAGRDVIEPGVTCEEVDRAARRVIDAAGLGDRFIHRTGHGIGLEVHEHPYLVEGNDATLEAGMAFSVEPGVYFDGRFGIRIEDIVVCTDGGSEVLNQSDRSLVSVG
jgi:Xaa-Pro aminopeptidase